MRYPIKAPQAQLPFVDEEGRLHLPSVEMLRIVERVIQGQGGILDTLTAMSAATGGADASMIQLREQIDAMGAQVAMLVAREQQQLAPVPVPQLQDELT